MNANDVTLTEAEVLYVAHGWSGCDGSSWQHLTDAAKEGWQFAAARLAAVEAKRDEWKFEAEANDRAALAQAGHARTHYLRAESAEQQLADLRASITAKRDEWTPGTDEWHEYDALLDNPTTAERKRCDTCSDTGRVPWMIEGDPNCYQERDADDTIPCLDCAHAPSLDAVHGADWSDSLTGPAPTTRTAPSGSRTTFGFQPRPQR